MARKKIQDMIEELRSWLPNYDHGPNSYPTLVWRLLASLPGGEAAEDMGYEPLGGVAWHEADQLGRMLEAIQDKRDVEELIAGLMGDEEGEVEERRRPAMHARTISTKNVFWRDIPVGARVELVGHSYVVTLLDGSRASVYWDRQDRMEAQRALNDWAKRGERPNPKREAWPLSRRR